MFYERLGPFDAAFLTMEDQGAPMHIAVVLTFDAAPLTLDDGCLDIDRIYDFFEAALDGMPRYRQRLDRVPIERHPVWVDDPTFNLLYHIRHTSVPRPGNERLLKRLAGRILSQTLDRQKPLWEVWVVEGLEGERFALIVKAHHCMVDGIAGMDVLMGLLRTTPDDSIPDASPWRPRPAPGRLELLGQEAGRRAKSILSVVRDLGGALTTPRRTIESARESLDALRDVVGGGVEKAADLPLNPAKVSSHRRFDWVRFDLDRLKHVKNRLGGTINDVVLATTAGAMRSFLQQRGVPVDDLNFRVVVPTNRRSENDEKTLGNRVATPLTRLPVEEADPRARLRKVVEATREMKASGQSQGMDLVEETAERLGLGLVNLLLQLAIVRGGYNLVVTNVPGPQIPVFLLGAPLLEMVPMLPCGPNQAISVAVMSYAGGLYWGLNSDWGLVPDLHDLAEALAASFEELQKLAADA
jgi:WS/DGAT/MGAT family acyltransferase